MTGLVDVELLNRLIGHKKFLYLLIMMKSYINEDTAAGIGTYNEMIDIAIVMNMVGQSVALDDESAELFKQLAGRVLDGDIKPVEK
jgi:hypothetical protein